jgi:hypothetical protein
MKTFAIVSALGAMSAVMATPTRTVEKGVPAKRADLPAISASGNGKLSQTDFVNDALELLR